MHRSEEAAELGVIGGESGEPFTDRFASPPGAIAGRRKLVAIKARSDVMRRRVGKWIAGQERERAGIVVEKFPDEMERPRIFSR